MSQSKREILSYFKKDFEESTDEVQDGELFSERDEVKIIYYGHYPEYREDFKLIEKKVKSFFIFPEENT